MNPTGQGRLLVVDDEPTIRELLSASLRFAGFTVTSAATGEQAVAEAARHRPDLVVLDVMLPGMDGFAVVGRLRAELGEVPILFLTARDASADKVRGLTAGGDDYVTKPFDLEELIARIHAIMRRTRGPAAEGVLTVAGLRLDPRAHQVLRDGEPVRLSPTEFRLLRYLMENAGQVLSKTQILNRVWRYDFGGDASIVESYIGYLRRKLDTGEPGLIHTVRGVGYVLRPPPGVRDVGGRD